MKLSEALPYLRMYEPLTYGIGFSPDEAAGMIDMGWIKWVPPIFGDSPTYAITDAGRAALENEDG